ncbi:hypothetical protein FQA39_LY02540 [Lamprigera yunnana]|nr:hypothetical protein FQA39_LY02540 [Lamprigera yunnana]
MSKSGKILNGQTREIVHNVFRYFLTQKEEIEALRSVKEKTSNATKVSVTTIERIINEVKESSAKNSDINNMIPESKKNALHSSTQPHLSEEGLIMPRKPVNPILENSERQNLHKELLFNQKVGKNVLNQKSELQRALEKHKDNIAKKGLEHHINEQAHELEKVIADRAKRRQDPVPDQFEEKSLSKEFLEARAKLRTRTDSNHRNQIKLLESISSIVNIKITKLSLMDIILDNSNKNLQTVPENVMQMVNLKMLYLGGNNIEDLPIHFFEQLSKLMWLDLRKNKLVTIPTTIANHEHLETILLQDNRIENLPNELGTIPKLKVLQISGNPLVYPSKDIIDQGVLTVCSFLKEQFQKLHNAKSECEISPISPKTSSITVSDDEQPKKESYTEKKISNTLFPVVVKSLSKNVEKNSNLSSSGFKKIHKITRGCSKILLHSHSTRSTKRKNDQVQNEELKEMWLKRLTDLLGDQEKILQQEKNLRALTKWRFKKKLEPMRELSLGDTQQPPYDIDLNKRMLSRKDLTEQVDTMIKKTKHKKRTETEQMRKINIQELIDEIVNQMKHLQTPMNDPKNSPRKGQEMAEKEIESIIKLHKKIVELQIQNEKV